MFNLFGARTMELNKQQPSGDYDEADVESYLTELITDFSRAGAMMTHGADEPGPAEGNAESDEIRRLQDDLKRAKNESEAFSRRLDEIEKERSRSEEELKSILSEKERIEERNRELQSANEDALNRIRTLTREKDDAVLGENDAVEKYLEQLKENSDLADELFNLRFGGGDQGNGEPEKTAEAGTSDGMDFESRYGEELATESGKELFMMLRGLLQDDTRDDNGVRMTKTWEEEVEETIPGEFPEDPAITRKVRTRSEVSVEYIAGHRNSI